MKKLIITLICIIIILLAVVCGVNYFVNIDLQNAPLENNVKESINDETITEVKRKSSKIVDKFIFVGDVILSERIRNCYDKGGVSEILDDEYKKLFDASDCNIGNLECAITDSEEEIEDKQFHFRVPTSYTKCLKEIGFNLMSLANNHIMDYGETGLSSTMDALKSVGIKYIGAGNVIKEAEAPYKVEIGDRVYAVFSCSQVFPNGTWKAKYNKIGINTAHDINRIGDRIKEVKNEVDKVIVFIHWGKELEEFANELQINTAHYLVDAGADLIVGAHSHTIQNIEYYKHTPIIYSLGNFIYGGTMRDTVVLDVKVDYSKNEEGDFVIRLWTGVANYLKTIKDWSSEVIKEKYENIKNKSININIDEDGYVTEKIFDEASLSEIGDLT